MEKLLHLAATPIPGSRERSCVAPQRAPLRSDQLRQVQLQRRGDRLQEERLSTTHLQRQGPGQRGMLSKVCSHGGRGQSNISIHNSHSISTG